MSVSRSDQAQLVGFALVLVVIAAANTLFDIAEGAQGPLRMVALSGGFLVALIAMYSLKSRVAALAVLACAFALSTWLMWVRLDPLAFHTLYPLLAWPLAAWGVSWLIVREVYPRLPADRAKLAPAVGGVLLVMHLGAGFGMLNAAHAFLKLDEAPVLGDAASLSEAVARRWTEGQSTWSHGVFVEAVVAPVPGGGLAARRDCAPARQGFWRQGPRLPIRQETLGAQWIDLILPDGTLTRVERVAHIRNTFAWPSTNADHRECGLSEGDPVVIRAVPREQGAGLVLRDTSLIAYGTPEAFLGAYAPRADLAARQFGGLGFLLMLSGLFPLLAGALHWWRARRA
ncbi:MAG: hypothetical protein R3D60_09750 [Paracoccaceae bacterium]